MPIVIKELFPSDPISEALEKINFNFDQLILAGGGPPGPQGPLGPPGIAGPQGDRGDHWQVGGLTGPTTDHGPIFGPLQDTDHWLDDNGDIWYWDATGATWSFSGLNLVGPTGPQGVTGGSNEWGIYYGASANSLGIGWYAGFPGPTTVDTSAVNFIIPINGYKNNLLLGDRDWSYYSLFNQAFFSGGVTGSYQRLSPKLGIVQNYMDNTGFGGIHIYALGLTGSTGGLGDYTIFQGGSTASQVNALDGFSAGFAIGNTASEIYHTFRARTNTLDFEIQAGDTIGSLNLGKTPKIVTRSNQFQYQDFDLTNPVAIDSIGSTGTRFRDKVIVGWTGGSGFTSVEAGIKFDVNGTSRFRGPVWIGDKTSANAYLAIGYDRSAAGTSLIDLFSDATLTESFRIRRQSGANGIAQLIQNGTGRIEYQTTSTGAYHDWLVNPGAGSTALMRLDTAGRLAIGHTTPLHRLDVDGYLGIDGISSQYVDISENFRYSGITPLSTNGGPGSLIRMHGGTGSASAISMWTSASSTGLAAGATMALTEGLRMISSGWVGIGTTAPIGKLTVDSGNLILTNAGPTANYSDFSLGIRFAPVHPTGSSLNQSAIFPYRSAADNQIGLSFHTMNGGLLPTSAIRILPVGHLELQSNRSIYLRQGDVYLGQGGETGSITNSSNRSIVYSTGSTSAYLQLLYNITPKIEMRFDRVQINDPIVILQNSGTNEQPRDKGLRFNLSGQSAPTTLYPSIVPFEHDASLDRIGLSFNTTDGSVNNETMRMVSYPEPGIQMANSTFSTSGPGFFTANNGGTLGAAGSLSTIATVSQTNYDRIIYLETQGHMEYNTLDLTAGTVYWRYEMINTTTLVSQRLKEFKMTASNGDSAMLSPWTFNFVLPAGHEFRVYHYRTAATYNPATTFNVFINERKLGLN
jgi:hypothetical protein